MSAEQGETGSRVFSEDEVREAVLQAVAEELGISSDSIVVSYRIVSAQGLPHLGGGQENLMGILMDLGEMFGFEISEDQEDFLMSTTVRGLAEFCLNQLKELDRLAKR